MNVKRLLLVSLLIWVINTVTTWLTCGWLFNWVYQIEPMIWKTPEIMMTPLYLVGSNIVGLLSAFFFVFVYAVIYKGIPSHGAKRGLLYGLLMWLLSSVAGIAGMPFYMTIAVTVVIYWIILFLVLNLITGAIIGALHKE